MLAILRNIINKIKLEGYDCNFIIGTKEQISHNDSEVPMFRFDPPRITKTPNTYDKVIQLNYIIGYHSEQNTNDIDTTDTNINTLEVMNDLFVYLLRSYTNSDGQQIYEVTDNYTEEHFYDFQILGHPTTGILVSIQLKQINIKFCTWETT